MFTPVGGNNAAFGASLDFESIKSENVPTNALTPNMTPIQILREKFPWSVNTPIIPYTNEKHSRCFTVEKRTDTPKPPFGFITPDLPSQTKYFVKYYKLEEAPTTPVTRGAKQEPINTKLEETSISLDEIYKYLEAFEQFNPEMMLSDSVKERTQTKNWLDTFTLAILEVDDELIKQKYQFVLDRVLKRLEHPKLQDYFDNCC